MGGVAQQARRRSAIRPFSRAILLRSAAIYVGSAVAAATPTLAQSGAAPASQAIVLTYNIPPQSLGSALTAFADVAGLRLLFPSSTVEGLGSSGLSGTFSRDEALSRLLAGTSLTYQFTSTNTVTILAASGADGADAVSADGTVALETITVESARTHSTLGPPPPPFPGGQVARGGQVGMLGNWDVMDTPFSMITYTRQVIEDQQARTVSDVLDNDPSIITSGGRYDVESIRGFQNITSTGSRSLNGLPGIAPIEFPSVDFIERVEVLKGPSALLNGMAARGSGSIGGTVNLTTEQATDDPITRFTPRYASDSFFGGHFDFGRRFGDNNEFGLRFNGSFDDGDTSVESQSAQNGVAALNLDYRGERVRISADVAHQNQEESPRANVVTVRNALATLPFIPAAPDSDKSLFPSWDNGRAVGTIGMIRGEVDILDNVTAYAAIGGQTFEKRFTTAGPLTILDSSGNYSSAPWVQYSDYDVLSMQGGLRATVNTGPVEHALSFNLAQAQYEERSSFWVGSTFNYGSIYDPIYDVVPTFVNPGPPKKLNESTVSSVGIADTMSFLNDMVLFTAGVRFQQVETGNFSSTTGLQTASYDNQAWSPSFGLVVKPWEGVSVYANYIEGLEVGTTVGAAYANVGEVFPPYVSEQYEVGVKFEWGGLTTTLSAFQISQPSAIVVPGTGGALPTLELDGEQRNRGIELNVFGEISDGIRLLGGVTFLDARQINTANGTLDGERAASAPAVRTVIGAEWDTPFVDGLTLTGRFTYTGDQVVVNNRPDLTIPSWTQLDVGARYTFASAWNDTPITIRFNVDNVTNESYWRGAYSNGLIYLSQPRTYLLSTTFNF